MTNERGSDALTHYLSAIEARVELIAQRVGAPTAGADLDGMLEAMPGEARSFVLLLIDDIRLHGESRALRLAAGLMLTRVLAAWSETGPPTAAPTPRAATVLH